MLNSEEGPFKKKVDFMQAYHQIPMQKENIVKMAITTPFDLFKYLCVPYGLSNAAQTFQRFMDEACHGLNFVYV